MLEDTKQQACHRHYGASEPLRGAFGRFSGSAGSPQVPGVYAEYDACLEKAFAYALDRFS